MTLDRSNRTTLSLTCLEDRCTPATFVVNNNDWTPVGAPFSPGSFQEAMNKSNTTAGVDTVNVQLAPNQALTITALSTVEVTEAVNIFGASTANNSVTLTGTKPLLFKANLVGVQSSLIQGVIFQGCSGQKGGAMEIEDKNTVTVQNCEYRENKSANNGPNPTDGGAVFVNSGGKIVISGGGPRPVNNGTFSGAQTLFFKNESVRDGGAIDNQGEVVLESAWFQENKAQRDGGAINMYGANSMVATAGAGFRAFKSNTATTGEGGAIYIGSNSGNSTLNGVTFTSNVAAKEGGGISIRGGTLALTGDSFGLNQAGAGGGDGGAMYIKNSTVSATSTTFRDNEANANGANQVFAVYVDNGGTFNTDLCAFSKGDRIQFGGVWGTWNDKWDNDTKAFTSTFNLN